MGVQTGLAALKRTVEQAAEGGKEFEKAKWFSLKGGQSATVRFLQEIDVDSKNFDPDRGPALIVSEISDPKNFQKKCVSTLDTEGKCFGTEMHKALQGTEGYNGGWKPRTRLYINVLVFPDNGDDPYVAILSQGVSGKSITPALAEYAEDSITDKVFKISRTGDDFNNTSYSLIVKSFDKEPFDSSEYNVYDLRTVAVREVPYAEQAEFFGYGEGSAATGAESAALDNIEW